MPDYDDSLAADLEQIRLKEIEIIEMLDSLKISQSEYAEDIEKIRQKQIDLVKDIEQISEFENLGGLTSAFNGEKQ